MLHLFSGQQKWKGPGLIVDVEKTRGADVLNDHVFQHLMGWAMRGLVGAVVGGPPCRTVSPCRSETDGGPSPVRGRIDGRWGLEGLTASNQGLVVEDSMLWLQFLMVYAVAQAAADGHPGSVWETRDPASYSPSSDITDPVELATWALQVAASHLQGEGDSSEWDPLSGEKPEDPGRRVMLVWEHPGDGVVHAKVKASLYGVGFMVGFSGVEIVFQLVWGIPGEV